MRTPPGLRVIGGHDYTVLASGEKFRKWRYELCSKRDGRMGLVLVWLLDEPRESVQVFACPQMKSADTKQHTPTTSTLEVKSRSAIRAWGTFGLSRV